LRVTRREGCLSTYRDGCPRLSFSSAAKNLGGDTQRSVHHDSSSHDIQHPENRRVRRPRRTGKLKTIPYRDKPQTANGSRPPTNIDFFRHELKIFSVRAIKNADGAKGIAKFFMLEYNVSTGIMFPKIFDFKEN